MTIDAESGLEFWPAREPAAVDNARAKAPTPARDRPQTRAEEIANALTHGLGLVLAAIGLLVLVSDAMARGGTPLQASCAIFGATMVCTYLASTLYHSVQVPHLKHRLRVFDHITIYLLIAGTYTPFMLMCVRGELGWGFCALVWALAGAGVIYKLVAFGKSELVSLASYLGMGWLAVFVLRPLWNDLPAGALLLLGAGVLSYTLGVVFYVQDDKRYFHTIWHLFVMAGTAFHFATVLLYVVPPAP